MISFIYSVILGSDEGDIPRGGWLCWTMELASTQDFRPLIWIRAPQPLDSAQPGGGGSRICKVDLRWRPNLTLAHGLMGFALDSNSPKSPLDLLDTRGSSHGTTLADSCRIALMRRQSPFMRSWQST